MYNSSWAPSNETSYQIFVEETWLLGAMISNVAYGVELTLFVQCFYLLAKQMNHRNSKRQISLLVFISIIFIFGTLFVGGSTKFAQQAFIEYRNFPGGPAAFEEVMFSDPVDQVANVSFIVGNWFMDAFLVRTTAGFLIFEGCRSFRFDRSGGSSSSSKIRQRPGCIFCWYCPVLYCSLQSVRLPEH